MYIRKQTAAFYKVIAWDQCNEIILLIEQRQETHF